MTEYIGHTAEPDDVFAARIARFEQGAPAEAQQDDERGQATEQACPICGRSELHWRWCSNYRPAARRQRGDEWDPYRPGWESDPHAVSYRDAVAAAPTGLAHLVGWAAIPTIISPTTTPTPAQQDDVRQHRMEPDCWCEPTDLGENAWQHHDKPTR